MHGVNCRGVMAAGIALIIAKKWPVVKDEYLGKFDTVGWHPGDVQFVAATPSVIIANCATRENYGRRQDAIYVDYDAIRTYARTVAVYAKVHAYSVALPRIGAGFAGGNWTIIRAILDEESNGVLFTVYVL